MPKDFYALLAPSAIKKMSRVATSATASPGENDPLSSSIKLARAPGVASLNIELSWRQASVYVCMANIFLISVTVTRVNRPTVCGTYVPSHEQLASVMASSRDDSDDENAKHAIELFAIKLERAHNSVPPFLRESKETDMPVHTRIFYDQDGLILTRAERQLVRGTFEPRSRECQESAANVAPRAKLPSPPSSYARQESRYDSLIHDSVATVSHKSLLGDVSRSLQSRHSGELATSPAQPSFTDLPENQPLSGHNSTNWAYSPNFSARLDTVAVEIEEPLIAIDTPADNTLSKSVVTSIARFRRLQDQTIPEQVTSHNETEVKAPAAPQLDEPQSSARHVPLDLLRDAEMQLPEPWQQPVSIHRYMASLGLIQKRVLALALSSAELGCIRLVERVELQDYQPDLIIDPHHAVLFVPISHLPTNNRDLTARLTKLLTSYSKILLIFECYPSSRSFGSTSSRRRAIRHIAGRKTAEPLEVDLFSPPVLTALKRFRRELAIERELAGHDSSGIKVQIVCAQNIEEAAMYARRWGDQAEAECASQVVSALWDERTWLQEDEDEVFLIARRISCSGAPKVHSQDASDLANFPGMNIFASTLLLSHISPNDFLDLDAASRLHYFGPLIGHIRIVSIWCKRNLEAAFTLVLSGAARVKLTASSKKGRTYSQIFRPSSRQMTILST